MRIIDRHTSRTTKDLGLIGTPRNVALTEPEQQAKERYDLASEGGASVRDAAEFALSAMLPSNRSEDFVTWLSEGTLRWFNQRLQRIGDPITKHPIITAQEAWEDTR